jgi:hypothetical protein
LVSANTDVVANIAKTSNASHTGDVTGSDALTIGDKKILAKHLNSLTTPTNGDVLSYSGTTNNFEWSAVTGITDSQASEIVENNAKVGYTEALVSANTDVVANTAKVGITDSQANEIVENNAKVGYTEALVSANTDVVANTAKTSNASHTGDVTGSDALTIGDKKVLAKHLNSLTTPTNGDVLSYSGTTNNFEWSSTVAVAVAVEDWQNVSFENSWANEGGSWGGCQYFKDAQGIVHIKGLVKGGVDNTTIFTLPVEYRPTEGRVFMGMTCTGTGKRIDVLTDGTVSLNGTSSSSCFISVEITFRP